MNEYTTKPQAVFEQIQALIAPLNAEERLALITRVIRFEQVLETYQATGDEALVDPLLDTVEGCLGEALPDEYDPNLKWGGYYEGR